MPSKRIYSGGAASISTPRSTPLENSGLEALIAASDAAIDRLLASIDWDAHDAALAELAAQADRAAQLLAESQNDHALGTVPAASPWNGEPPT